MVADLIAGDYLRGRGVRSSLGSHRAEGGGGQGGAGTGAGAAGSGAAGGGKAGESGGAEGGEEGDPDDPPVTLKKSEKDKIIKQRDAAKRSRTELAEALGLEEEEIDDPDKPGKKKKVWKGLDEALANIKAGQKAAAAARKAAGGKAGAGGAAGDGEDDHDAVEAAVKAANDKAGQKLAKVQAAAAVRQSALESLVSELAVSAPLVAALAAEGAVDDLDAKGNPLGTYSDLVKLLKPRLRAAIEFDDETNKAAYAVNALDDDGDPVLDGKGKPTTIRAFVAEFLKTRPHFRKGTAPRGPGAGNYGGGSGGGNRGSAPAVGVDRGREAALSIFGSVGRTPDQNGNGGGR